MQHELVDPKKAISPDLNRRAFVGLSAGAATLTTGITGALAQQGYGKPHPPIVAENDPSITVKWVKLHWLDGDIDAYTAVPKNATATTPGSSSCNTSGESTLRFATSCAATQRKATSRSHPRCTHAGALPAATV